MRRGGREEGVKEEEKGEEGEEEKKEEGEEEKKEEGSGGYDERIASCFQRSPTTRPGSHCSKHSVGKR